MPNEHIHFVTGRLAQHALREVLAPLATEVGFAYSIDVLPITVAALMTPAWMAGKVKPHQDATRIIIPGYCEGDPGLLESAIDLPVEKGPRNLMQLPSFFSTEPPPTNYGGFDIEIIAEINHCPQLTLQEILRQAAQLSRDGADVIDVGCDPGGPWDGVHAAVKALRAEGHRVSIDSFHPQEVEQAVFAGAELVLSTNSTNREAVADLCTNQAVEVVIVPDDPTTLAGLDDTVDYLESRNVRLRIDPVLEPIGFGFAASLRRYLAIRERYPDAEMMMGIGNLTELTDADSAGINVLLLGFCQELGIRSVLTTQVINWARTSVRECDLARRLMFHVAKNRVLPKHLEPRLVMLRDEQIVESTPEFLGRLAEEVRDSSYRIHAVAGKVHLIGRQLHLQNADPFVLIDQLQQTIAEGNSRKTLEPEHAFYLGYEMCKAATALALGKTYQQDEPLDWGMLTQQENRHYLRSKGD